MVCVPSVYNEREEGTAVERAAEPPATEQDRHKRRERPPPNKEDKTKTTIK